MRGPRPRSASSAGPGPSSPPTASPGSCGSLPTTGRATAPGPSPQPLPPWPHATRGSAPTPTSQRQGRAIQPHLGRGVSLRTPLFLKAAAPRYRRGVEPPRQLPSTPHCLPQPASCHPRPSTRHQHHDLIHLGEGQPLPRWSLGVLQRLGRC